MNRERTAGWLGILASIALVILTILPYVVGRTTAVGAYYAAGFGSPLLAAVFAMIATIAFAAGLYRRSDPAVIAGVTIVLGLFIFTLAATWAVAVTPELIGGVTAIDAARHHRWLLVGVALAITAAAATYTTAVL